MAIEVWGDKPKSQVDPSTVDEEIDLKINDHLDDPDAHLEAGQSLQSHKASEIIDHVAGSIVEDKLADLSVSPRSLNYNKVFYRTNFTSIDDWYQYSAPTDSVFEVMAGACLITGGSVLNSLATLVLSAYTHYAKFDKNPFFQAILNFTDIWDSVDFLIGCGSTDLFQEDVYTFGFFWDQSASKLYGFSNVYGSITYTEITGFDVDAYTVVRAEYNDTDHTVKFYINNILFATQTGKDLGIDSDILICLSVKNVVGGSLNPVPIENLIFSQDL